MLYAKLIGSIALFTCENIAHIDFYLQGLLPKILAIYTIKADTAMTSRWTSEAYRANYTNTNFIKVFVNVMDLSEAFVSFGILASAGFSLGPFHFPSKSIFFLNSCHLFTPLKSLGRLIPEA